MSDTRLTDCDDKAVTPEMIEAGVIPLYQYHPETGVGDEETVVTIFREMYRASFRSS